jgi:SAM-dependent methyltransferase
MGGLMAGRLIPRRRSQTEAPVPESTPSTPANDTAAVAVGFQPAAERTLAPQPEPASGIATETLFERLSRPDVEEIESRLSDEHRATYDHAGALGRKRLALAYGLHYGAGNVERRTGLTAAMPPEGVHFMGRGMLVEQTGGAYYYADLVLEWLSAGGQTLAANNAVLDFSCSSGRVLRPLAAARGDVNWHGCDPNTGAIAWADKSLPGMSFFVSDTSPPLPFDDGALDAVYAISVWSHFSASAALRWFEEMHRVIRPGGHLIFTTHGLQSTVWFSVFRDPYIEQRLGDRWVVDSAERLERDGHCFWSVFGEQGDEGVVASDWGLAFFTPEWLMERVTPAWTITQYRIGRADGNQDAFALRRR